MCAMDKFGPLNDPMDFFIFNEIINDNEDGDDKISDDDDDDF